MATPRTELRLVVPRRPDRRIGPHGGPPGAGWAGGNRRSRFERRSHGAAIERQLEEAALCRAIVEAAPDALAVLDVRGTVVAVNPEFERLFGYQTMELVGEVAEKLFPSATGTVYFDWCRRCATQAEPLRLVLDGRRHDGSHFPLELALNLLATPFRQLIVATMRDATEHCQALEALRQQTLRLSMALRRLRAAVEVLRQALGNCPRSEQTDARGLPDGR